MKKNCLLGVLIAIAMFSVNATIALCQSIPCITTPPDCTSDPWSGPVTTTVTLPNGCVVTVIYRHRISLCGKDIAIEKITKQFGNAACNSLTIAQIVDQTALEVVKLLAGPRLSEGQCETQWRAFKASCWYETQEDYQGTIVTSYYPCGASVCCWKTYQICKTSSGITSTVTSVQQSAQQCPVQTPTCSPVCDE